MAIPSSTPEKSANKKQRTASEQESRVRKMRTHRGLTQTELARRAGMHRNTIARLENGTTREITSENATALAAVLKTSTAELGLRLRASGEAPSIRFRRLSPEQRQIVDELLSLPPEDYALIRGAIERLRRKRPKTPRRGARR
jgi:transcriptional regulator with XRE-family HTH domain